MSRAAEVGEETGWFKVPRILKFVESEGVLELERITDLVKLRDLVYEGYPRLIRLMESAGRALAGVHGKLELPSPVTIPLVLDFHSDREDEVFVHGDFTADNVAWSEALNSLYVLDWSTAPLFKGIGNKATRYFDLVWFSFFLFVSAHRRIMGSRNGSALVKAFLAGYSQAGQRFDLGAFRRTARGMRRYLRVALDGHRYRSHGLRKWTAMVILGIAWLEWNRFVAD